MQAARATLGALLILSGALAALPAAAKIQDRWVSAWGTAQQLAPQPVPKMPPRPAGDTRPVPPPPQTPSPLVPTPETIGDQTLRMLVRPSIGGTQIRLQFSNASGGAPVTFAHARLARSAGDARTAPGSDHVVTFSGAQRVTIQPGAVAISDPIALPVKPLETLAVSIHLPDPTPANTIHPLGLRTTYIAPGDHSADADLPGAQTNRSYFWLTGLEVQAPAPAATIVAFGDSITDGYGTTPGRSAAWPDLLAERLQGDAATRHLAIVNMGISGNRVRRDGAGLSALARFDRDVLARPGVRWMILLEGINDINIAAIPGIPPSEDVDAAMLIAAYTQLIERAHLHGIKVMGATLTPTEGLWMYGPRTETIRQAVNAWIRTSGRFDAVVDFDAAVRDPARPARLNPAYDPGDHVHPNDAGNAAMAAAVPVTHFAAP